MSKLYVVMICYGFNIYYLIWCAKILLRFPTTMVMRNISHFFLQYFYMVLVKALCLALQNKNCFFLLYFLKDFV